MVVFELAYSYLVMNWFCHVVWFC